MLVKFSLSVLLVTFWRTVWKTELKNNNKTLLNKTPQLAKYAGCVRRRNKVLKRLANEWSAGLSLRFQFARYMQLAERGNEQQGSSFESIIFFFRFL